MSFLITVAGIEELSAFQMTTDVSIERRVYDHSRARVTFEWVEDGLHSERRIAALAASCLNCTTNVQWKGYGAAEAVPCFHGYVEQAAGDRAAGRSRLTLDCVSMSKRADLAPRYRAFQACQLLDICRQVAKSEPLIKIGQAGDLSFDIALSIQYGETDYAYLSRMLHAWGIPMAVSDTTGQVTLGARGVAAGGAFPDLDFRWSEVSFSGGTGHYPKRQNTGSGASHTARAQVDQLNGQVKPAATAYYPIPDSQPTRERHSAAHSQSDTSCYRLTFEGGVLAFSPGDVVAFEGQDHIVRAVRITGHPTVSTATQEFELQPYTLPYAPEQHPPQWASRTLWAWVVENEHDPAQRGRIQVKFDLEALDPQASSEKVWLHTLTPYGGGKSPGDGKAGAYNGIYSLPEVGERVLVEFLGEWDSEAVVIGTVREKGVSPMFNAKDTKRWRLPSGTEIAMTSKGSTEIVRLRCKDKIFFESKMDGANAEVYITPGESDGDIIHFQKGSGPPSLYIQCGGTITIKAQQALHLEGQQVQITASGGMVSIDGSPNVMINSGPTPAQPLQMQKFQEAMGSTSGEQRQLPGLVVGTAAGAAALLGPLSKSVHNDGANEDLRKATHMAEFAGAAYGDTVPDGATKLGIDGAENLTNDGSGFDAKAYRDKDGTIVIAYRGTDVLSPADWWNNAKQALGFKSRQYTDAAQFAQRVKDQYPNSNIMITGHSLGGGLAAVGAAAIGAPAITFNAAGVHPDTFSRLNLHIDSLESQIVNYRVKGEVLTGLQNHTSWAGIPTASGSQVDLEARSPDGDKLSGNPLTRHTIHIVQEALEYRLQQ